MNDTFADKISKFAELLQNDQLRGLEDRGVACASNRANARTSVKLGGKYAKVDVGSSGRYMVVIATGEIFGIKGYGVIHRGHYYGTLDTIGDYDWSQYYPTKRDGSVGCQPGRGTCPVITHAPACDHRFMGTNFCIKCGKLAADIEAQSEAFFKHQSGGVE